MKLLLGAFLIAFGAAVIFTLFTIDATATAGTLATVFVAIVIERRWGL